MHECKFTTKIFPTRFHSQKKPAEKSVGFFSYWVGESNSYCKIENLEY